MFAGTDIKQAPWYLVNADNKKEGAIERDPAPSVVDSYRDLTSRPLPLPPITKKSYTRPPIDEQTFIPEVYQ